MAVVQEAICTAGRDSSWRAASWRCALVTLAGVPLSFFGMLYMATFDQKDFNGPAVALYFYLCLVLVVPLALVNSSLIAPYIAKTVCGRLSATSSHAILAIVWAGVVFGGYLAVPRLPAALDWVMLFWNLTTFLGPAVIVGSFVYSLKWNSMRRKESSCT